MNFLRGYRSGISKFKHLNNYWTQYYIVTPPGTYNPIKVEYSHLKGKGSPYPPQILINGKKAFQWKRVPEHYVDMMISLQPLEIEPSVEMYELMTYLSEDDFNDFNLKKHDTGFLLNWKEKTLRLIS